MTIEAAFFGTLSRDAVARTSKTGKPYLQFNVRVGDSDASQWVNVMTFDEKAIEVADKMLKGARVYVEGRLSLDEWTAQDGTAKRCLSAMSWHCRLSQIGRSKAKRSSDGTATSSKAANPATEVVGSFDDPLPF